MKITAGPFLVASLALVTRADFTFQCTTITTERLDPLVFPGTISPHVHAIAGGSGLTMQKPSGAQMLKSACTSCEAKADKSAYWHPELYFQYANGSFELVPSADMTVVYYQNGREKIYPFPEGFRMISGDPFLRSNQSTPGQLFNSVQFTCIGESGEIGYSLPSGECEGGIIAQVEFPSCWNGKDLDTPNHSSHMAFAGTDNNFLNGGTGEHAFPLKGNANCPADFPKRLPSLIVERRYNTHLFDKSLALNRKQPFVFAMGDPTGYGFHADFINGWDSKVLTKAIATCTSPAYGFYFGCPALGKLQPIRQSAAPQAPLCQKTPTVNEAIFNTTLTKLPGCNPVLYGPQTVGPSTCNNLKTPNTFKPATYSGPVPPVGASEPLNQPTVLPTYAKYKFSSCFSVPKSGSALQYNVPVKGKMTAQSCLTACRTKKYKYCGLTAKKCYGGKSISKSSKKASLGSCWSTCGDNFCGGPSHISIYQ